MQSKQNINNLINKIFEVTNLSFDDIFSPSRKKEIVNARAAMCHIMRFKLDYTCEEIGYMINRNHSTVSRLSSSKKIDELIKKLCL